MTTADDHGRQTGRAPPVSRVVVLGASNVRRGLPSLVNALREARGRPLDLMMATGHGRSYGMGSRVLGRTLPAILTSGLWPALEKREPVPTVALVTDVGNDILYGAPADVIAAWVQEAVRRLADVAERIVITGLPLAGIDALGSMRYLAVRSILFPRCRVTLPQARETAHAIDDALRDLASQRGASYVEPAPAWYGLDPIHVRRAARDVSWRTALAPLIEGDRCPRADAPWGEGLHLRRLRPERRLLFGVEQVTQQPCGTLHDATNVSLY